MSTATAGVLAPTFFLDRKTHTYWYEGRQIPGISFLLKWHRYVDPTYYSERGRQIGNALHAWSWEMDLGRLDWTKLRTPEVIGRLRAYEKMKAELGIEILEIERSYAHAGGLYACTIDRLVRTRLIDRAILELKAGNKEPWHLIQTGMQRRAVPGRPRRLVAYLHEDGTYHSEEHTDTDDEQIGVNLASDYHWRLNHGYPTSAAA